MDSCWGGRLREWAVGRLLPAVALEKGLWVDFMGQPPNGEMCQRLG